VLGRKSKIRKAVDRALAAVHEDDDVADHSPIDALAAGLQVEAFYTLALALYDDDRHVAAQISLARAVVLAPEEADLHRLSATIASELGDVEGAIAAQTRVVASLPQDAAALAALADLLIGDERIEDVIALLDPRRGEDPVLDTRLAEALYLHDRHDRALAILDEVCALYETQLKRGIASDWQALKARAEDADRLRNDVYAEVHGREATIELAAAAGKLDARAGVNYRLLGARLATTSDRIADVLTLQCPDTTEQRGKQLLTYLPARGLVLIGSSQLRRGDLSAARKTFERACEEDGGCFAAFLGLGAALDYDRYNLHRRVAKLVVSSQPPVELSRVVPDLGVLTDLERRVVWASAQPLLRLLPVLAERGTTMRILPIDVRATDIGLFEDAAGERAADHRSYDAVTGVATHGGAIAKIEELLDVVSDGGWTFAHELAHLAFFHMSDAQSEPLLEIYDRALEVGYANTEYALSNADEFFAVSYADFLRQRHELPGVPEPDETGILAALTSYFRRLAAA
jgi:tetratricopeptide (TPR) repeat protein